MGEGIVGGGGKCIVGISAVTGKGSWLKAYLSFGLPPSTAATFQPCKPMRPSHRLWKMVSSSSLQSDRSTCSQANTSWGKHCLSLVCLLNSVLQSCLHSALHFVCLQIAFGCHFGVIHLKPWQFANAMCSFAVLGRQVEGQGNCVRNTVEPHFRMLGDLASCQRIGWHRRIKDFDI